MPGRGDVALWHSVRPPRRSLGGRSLQASPRGYSRLLTEFHASAGLRRPYIECTGDSLRVNRNERSGMRTSIRGWTSRVGAVVVVGALLMAACGGKGTTTAGGGGSPV